jgi:hypothetical protein
MEETGWESRMASRGRAAARLLEKDCVPADLTLEDWIDYIATEESWRSVRPYWSPFEVTCS